MTTSRVLSLFFFFLLEEIKLRSNRTPHPPRTCCCFSCFFPAALFCFACFGRASLFVSGVSSGCHSGPRAVFGFSRDCSEAFSWTLGGKGVCSFLVCCFSRFAAHTFLVGLAPGLRKAGPRVVSPAPLARVRARGRMPFSGGGTQTPSCLVSFCF